MFTIHKMKMNYATLRHTPLCGQPGGAMKTKNWKTVSCKKCRAEHAKTIKRKVNA